VFCLTIFGKLLPQMGIINLDFERIWSEKFNTLLQRGEKDTEYNHRLGYAKFIVTECIPFS
jgi:G:T-mismatch repair DNA endonuclease (very short patch repair protein)